MVSKMIVALNLVIFLFCTAFVESASAERTRTFKEEMSKRIILHSDTDILTVLKNTQVEIASMNATFSGILAQQKAETTSLNATLTGKYANSY